MNKRDDTPKQDESPDAARRGFLQQASALGAGAALTAAPLTGMAAGELASGMTGGPTGFAGAERFQYNDTMSEGRAIAGIKKLKAAGKVPKKLTMLLTDGAIGQITKPFPVGKVGSLSFPAGAPSVKEVWERETGIEIDIVGVSGTVSPRSTMLESSPPVPRPPRGAAARFLRARRRLVRALRSRLRRTRRTRIHFPARVGAGRRGPLSVRH